MRDWYKTNHFFLFTLLFLFLIPISISVPPFLEQQASTPFTEGLIVDYEHFVYYPSGRYLELSFHVYNISTGRMLGNDTISCLLHIYNDTGEIFYNLERVKAIDKPTHFIMNVNDTLLLKAGSYAWDIYCNTSYLGGFSSGNAELTQTGGEEPTPNTEDEYFLYFVFVLAIVILIVSFMKNDSNLASISGMILLILGGYIIVYGFSSLNNTLSSGVGIVLIGVGAYILIRSNLDYITWG
jgi:hypothetical protein